MAYATITSKKQFGNVYLLVENLTSQISMANQELKIEIKEAKNQSFMSISLDKEHIAGDGIQKAVLSVQLLNEQQQPIPNQPITIEYATVKVYLTSDYLGKASVDISVPNIINSYVQTVSVSANTLDIQEYINLRIIGVSPIV